MAARGTTPGSIEAAIEAEFDQLDATIAVVGAAMLAEIERLRALLRQLPPSLGITEKDITGAPTKLHDGNPG